MYTLHFLYRMSGGLSPPGIFFYLRHRYHQKYTINIHVTRSRYLYVFVVQIAVLFIGVLTTKRSKRSIFGENKNCNPSTSLISSWAPGLIRVNFACFKCDAIPDKPCTIVTAELGAPPWTLHAACIRRFQGNVRRYIYTTVVIRAQETRIRMLPANLSGRKQPPKRFISIGIRVLMRTGFSGSAAVRASRRRETCECSEARVIWKFRPRSVKRIL